MGFTTPDQATMEQARDAADAAHKDHWANNGGSPNPETFFPGFEAGWHAACEALSNGGGLPNAEEHGGSEGWEWKHGFAQGAEAAKQAGEHADE